MTERLPYPPTRRQVATAMTMALCGLASASSAWAQGPQPPEQEKPGTSPNQMRTSLQEEIHLKSNPQRIYAVLLDAKQFAAFTGQPAEIDPKAGGAFPCSQDKSLGETSSWFPTSASCRRGALRIGPPAPGRSLPLH
jgi:hypothetical protein